jgi:ubiquinone/menaquinone biosynthesis C-methylase UbiE
MALLESVDYRRFITALDIGSGTGFPAIELAQRLGEDSTVYALDPWAKACERIRRKSAFLGINNVHTIESNAEKLPFDDSSIDLIVSNNGINNVEDPNAVLEECHRVSRKDAQLVITANLPNTFSLFYDVFRSVLRRNDMRHELSLLEEHIHDKRKPKDYTEAMLERAGFRIEETRTAGFNMIFANGSAFLNHSFVKMAFAPAWEAILPDDKRESIIQQVRVLLDVYASDRGRLALEVPFAVFDCKLQ